jgi:hypothetical protein
MEWFWAIFGISGLLLALWVIAAGDRSDAMTGEPTLNTRGKDE